jgi:thiamine-phosphate pyrophosphorylase
VVAIGGVNRSNAADLLDAGAAGLAVVSAIMGATDPRLAARELAATIAAARG